VRAYVEHNYTGCIGIEGIIGIVWSGIISIFGFTFMYISKIAVGYKYALNKIFAGLIMAVISTIIITSISIISVVITFPCTSHFVTARGVIAAIAVRTVLFVNLVNSQLYGQKIDFPSPWNLLDQLKNFLLIKNK
jgi:hypothetical protein